MPSSSYIYTCLHTVEAEIIAWWWVSDFWIGAAISDFWIASQLQAITGSYLVLWWPTKNQFATHQWVPTHSLGTSALKAITISPSRLAKRSRFDNEKRISSEILGGDLCRMEKILFHFLKSVDNLSSEMKLFLLINRIFLKKKHNLLMPQVTTCPKYWDEVLKSHYV